MGIWIGIGESGRGGAVRRAARLLVGVCASAGVVGGGGGCETRRAARLLAGVCASVGMVGGICGGPRLHHSVSQNGIRPKFS